MSQLTPVAPVPCGDAAVFDDQGRILLQFVCLCRVIGFAEATTPHEVLDVGWFGEAELPALSPGHAVRVPDAFRFRREGRPFFDRPALP